MPENFFFIALILAILFILFLTLKVKIHPFIVLLGVSIVLGLVLGIPLAEVVDSVQNGMAGIMGYIAIVVGLGAIFGQILESSGAAHQLAQKLLSAFGEKKAHWALSFVGFLVAIPIFFEIGFILLVPLVYSLSKSTGKSLLMYAIPFLAGLAVTHAFIPPTPGPVAVAHILDVDLGWVILFGSIVGIPTVIIAGPLFGKFIANKIHIPVPDHISQDIRDENTRVPLISTILFLVLLPLVLIVCATLVSVFLKNGALAANTLTDLIIFIGHPIVTLLIVTLLSIYLLGMRNGFSKEALLKLSSKALGPAGVIILVTGAGGVLKQILIDSGIGTTLANLLGDSGISPIVLAYAIAVLLRVSQGSATVAMITSAGIIAPILSFMDLSDPSRALVVISIASGSTFLSHVNDSGFWLVHEYLGMNEKQTLYSWSTMESIISVVGFLLCLLFYQFV